MSDDSLQLSDEQLSILLNSREIREQGGEPRVINADDLETIRNVLSDALAETTGLPAPESLTVEQMAMQLDADRDDAVEALTLTQQPETGGVDPDDLEQDDALAGDDPVALLEQADQETRDAVEREIANAQAMHSRTPDYADELRRSALERLGLETDDTDAIAVLEREIPSDPRLLV